jgi:hypothetical protein
LEWWRLQECNTGPLNGITRTRLESSLNGDLSSRFRNGLRCIVQYG